MVKFSRIFASALVGLAIGQDTPTVSLSDTQINIEFPLASTIGELTYLVAGTCTQDSTEATFSSIIDASAGTGVYSLDILIDECGLAMGSEVTFQIGSHSTDDNGDEVKLTFYEYSFTLDPEYTYTITYSYGKVTTNTTTITANDLGVSFTLQAYDETWTTPNSIDDRMAGEYIHLGLTINEPADFDHEAYNFVITNCKIQPVGGAVQYTFFDHARDACSNDMIGLNLAYDSAAEMWQLSHLLFLLNGVSGDELEIVCEAKVCHSSLAGSTCDAVATNCLDCQDQPCSINGVCSQNSDFSDFECECLPGSIEMAPGISISFDFMGKTCDTISTCSTNPMFCGMGTCVDLAPTSQMTVNGMTLAATEIECDCTAMPGFSGLGCATPDP